MVEIGGVTPCDAFLDYHRHARERVYAEMPSRAVTATWPMGRRPRPCPANSHKNRPTIQGAICNNMPFQPGNQEARKAKKAKPFRDALRIEVTAANRASRVLP